MSITIVVNNCWDCPYRDKNVGGKVPHYCRKSHSCMSNEDFPKYCPLMQSDSSVRRKKIMKEYMVTVNTGIVGYEFEEIVEAEGDKEATEKALKAVDNKLKYMKNHRKVVKVVAE